MVEICNNFDNEIENIVVGVTIVCDGPNTT